jgi:hypothetical protein
MNERFPQVPSYERGWIKCTEHWPERELPVLWKPYSDGPNIPQQFIATMNEAFREQPMHHGLPQTWSWRPTGIYREYAWENGYLKFWPTATGDGGSK